MPEILKKIYHCSSFSPSLPAWTVINPRKPKSVHPCKEKLHNAQTPLTFHQFSNYSFSKGTKGKVWDYGIAEVHLCKSVAILNDQKLFKEKKKTTRDSHPAAGFLKLKFEEERNTEKTGGTDRAVG